MQVGGKFGVSVRGVKRLLHEHGVRSRLRRRDFFTGGPVWYEWQQSVDHAQGGNCAS
jgi:hypothetical protein